MRTALRELMPELAACTVAAMLAGAADVLVAGSHLHDVWALVCALVGAALLGPLGALLGVPFALAARWLARHSATSLLVQRALEEPERSWLWPLGAALVLALASGAWLFDVYVRAALALQDDAFAGRLSSFVFALVLAALVVLTLVLAPLFRWLGARLGRKLSAAPGLAHGLRLGASHGALWLAIVWAASFALGDADLLGRAVALPYALAIFLLAIELRLSFAARLPRRARGRVFFAVVLGAFVAAGPLASALGSHGAALARSLAPAAVSGIAARATDFDRDGQSSLFGGADCAAFDPKRGPFAFDVPGNHVDEDCDGSDAVASKKGGTSDARPNIPLPAELVRRYNVVFIVIDAFRADHLGRAKTLTPELDRLTRESVRFTAAYSQAPSTRISFPSFLTGLWPARVQFVREGGLLQLGTRQDTMAALLSRAGYQTAFVINGWMRTHLIGARRGYDTVLSSRSVDSRPIERRILNTSATSRAVEYVERARLVEDKPFFLTVYYDGPHAPYEDLSDLGLPAKSKRSSDRYDAEIRYVDQQVGRLLDHLRMRPKLWENTVVVVTSDHGEEFGEHGGAYHDRTCYGESTHVPLLVRVPGVEPLVAPNRVALVDVAPTLMALTGTPLAHRMDGRNLIGASAARYAHEPDARVYCSFYLDPDPMGTQLQALRDGRFTFVRRFKSDTVELYDVKSDPREQNDLVLHGAPSELVRRYKRLLSLQSLPRGFLSAKAKPAASDDD